MPVVSKPCIFLGSCSGDLGDTEVWWFGDQLCVSKASNIVKVFGALETALGYINSAVVICKKQRKCLERLYWSLLYLSFYLSTGVDVYYSKSLSILKKTLKCIYRHLPDTPLGWVVCRDKCCVEINKARVWTRWAERRMAALSEGREAILILNHLGSALFELMRTCRHGVVANRRLIEIKTVETSAAFPNWW
ncbi:MAG: ATP:cob(I)alamin adenosyltransferase [Pyrobaculum sp.]